jgi:glycosyltransferase involved in cell wall biosynthesis
MRIGIDGLVLRSRNAGTLRYVEQLIGALSGAGVGHEYVIFGPSQVFQSECFPRPGHFQYQFVNANRLLPAALQQQAFRGWEGRGKLDILHSPAFVPPLLYRGKTIMTVFDLTFRVYPQSMKWTGRFWWRVLGKRGITHADRLIAISENTNRELQVAFGIPAKKIRVIYPYRNPDDGPGVDAGIVRAKYGLPDRYILYVGTLERRKNLVNLIRAFAQARRLGLRGYQLVLAGRKGWLYEDIFRSIQVLDVGQEVVFPGYIAEADLPGLYAGASLFLFLSRYEGFGYPILEALAYGVPVISSDAASLPEVVGEAGILVSPDDIDGTARAIVRVLSDRALQADLVSRGRQQAGRFSRERFTRQVLEAYTELGIGGG